MTQTTSRDAAAQLARRIESSRIDPSKTDEKGRPPGDKPPAFAEALMSEAPQPHSIEHRAHLEAADWDIIDAALEHYAACQK